MSLGYRFLRGDKLKHKMDYYVIRVLEEGPYEKTKNEHVQSVQDVEETTDLGKEWCRQGLEGVKP